MKAYLLHHHQLDPRRWDHFIGQSPQAGVYALYGYASAVEPDWQAIIVEDGGRWQAVMPLSMRSRWRYQACLQPLFAQYWGIFFAPHSPASPMSLGRQKKCIEAILGQLPKCQLFSVYFSPRFTYPLPFYWRGFELHTRYTYQLSLQAPATELFNKLAPPLRRQINKAERAGMRLEKLQSFGVFSDLLTLNRKTGKSLPDQAGVRTLRQILDYLRKNELGELYGLLSPTGEVLAAGMFMWYRQQAVYLLGVQLPAAKSSGAMSCLLWRQILAAKTRNCEIFDFEGSMIAGIETFFRKFGAQPVPYLHIYKNNLPILIKWIRELR